MKTITTLIMAALLAVSCSGSTGPGSASVTGDDGQVTAITTTPVDGTAVPPTDSGEVIPLDAEPVADQPAEDEVSITITVSDDAGNPLADATVVLNDEGKETVYANLTDPYGQVVLSVPVEAADSLSTVEITRDGFESLEIPLDETDMTGDVAIAETLAPADPGAENAVNDSDIGTVDPAVPASEVVNPGQVGTGEVVSINERFNLRMGNSSEDVAQMNIMEKTNSNGDIIGVTVMILPGKSFLKPVKSFGIRINGISYQVPPVSDKNNVNGRLLPCRLTLTFPEPVDRSSMQAMPYSPFIVTDETGSVCELHTFHDVGE